MRGRSAADAICVRTAVATAEINAADNRFIEAPLPKITR